MPTLAVGMRKGRKSTDMPTASVGMAPDSLRSAHPAFFATHNRHKVVSLLHAGPVFDILAPLFHTRNHQRREILTKITYQRERALVNERQSNWLAALPFAGWRSSPALARLASSPWGSWRKKSENKPPAASASGEG